jgi:hypothetical protein
LAALTPPSTRVAATRKQNPVFPRLPNPHMPERETLQRGRVTTSSIFSRARTELARSPQSQSLRSGLESTSEEDYDSYRCRIVKEPPRPQRERRPIRRTRSDLPVQSPRLDRSRTTLYRGPTRTQTRVHSLTSSSRYRKRLGPPVNPRIRLFSRRWAADINHSSAKLGSRSSAVKALSRSGKSCFGGCGGR